MNNGLLSPQWYRVAKLQIKLHSHVEIHRHDYRGLIWYMLEDTMSERSHRFNSAAYQFIGHLNGQQSVQEIYNQISAQLDEYAPGQEEIIQLLGQLYAADLIQSDVLVNTEELFQRQSQQKQTKLKQWFSNPVAQKIPLWDPEDFLNRHFNKVRWLFSRWVALLWLLIISYTVIQTSIHWPEINRHFSINALSPYNLLLLYLLYPPIKILHELGHAFSAKLEGGEVHEMGVNSLMFMPIPYVNVSTATHFRSKYKRMLVSAAGILVESFLAALGVLLFLAAEPGIIQNIGFNIFIIGGISSIFFNGNPLLKFDGYYILADGLGIPNLFQRSSQYWRYFFQRYLFNLDHVSSPANAPGETIWFIIYSISSLAYRLSILWFICIYVIDTFLFMGIILAIWLAGMQIILPLFKAILFVIQSPSLKHNRKKAIISCLAFVSLFILVLGYLPVPSYTLTEGVVWLPDEAQVKVEQDGFIGELLVKNNQIVKTNTPIVQLHDAFVESQVKIAQAKLVELKSQYRAKQGTEFVKAKIIKDQINVAKSELKHSQHKANTLLVTAFKSGKILLPDAEDLPGRFVRKGELIGYILDDKPPTIRMAVKQDHIGQLRQGITDIKIRLANNMQKEYSAVIIRQAPEATNRLPSAALATIGGGLFTLNPNSSDNLLALENFFLIDLSFDPQQSIPLGTRSYIRINHGSEALAKQWYRRLRQVFLRQFNV